MCIRDSFSFLKWSAKSFDNVQIVPPGVGICHQLNIERFCQVAITDGDQAPVMYFDSLVGTDSHTTTANGMGVLGWGVGGIEAEEMCIRDRITHNSISEYEQITTPSTYRERKAKCRRR